MEYNNDQKTKSSEINTVRIHLMRRNEVEKITGLSRSSIYALMQIDAFPKSVSLVADGKSVAWVSTEIDDWIIQRIQARDGAAKRKL